MKKIISVLFFLMLINSITFAESYLQNSSNPSSTYPATNPTQKKPRYIFSPVIASFESFIITPQQVEAGQTLNFQLQLVGRDNLEVDIFYEEVLLTRLVNEGQGLYSGTYLVPIVPTGSYTSFRAIASNEEGEVELFTTSLPGIQVNPTPALSVRLSPTEVTIGESLLFTADVIGFHATSVEAFYLANNTRIPLTNLTKQTENSVDPQIFQGDYAIPSGVPAGLYDQFFAEATNANNEQLQAPFNQTVTLNTDCATVNVTVSDIISNDPLPGATISVAGKTKITDASGQASITQLIDNTEQMLLVTAPGFLPPEPKLIQLNCLAEINETAALEPTIKDCAQLDVTVIDDSELASPIPGASISIASQTDTTNEQGKATFTGLIEGSQTIIVNADDFFTALPKDVELSCDAVTSESIRLTSKKCATLQARVVNISGEGIPDAEVSIPNTSITGTTDSEGLVTLENILEGIHTVNVTASGFGPDAKSVELLCDTPILDSFILDICAEVDVIVSGSDEARLPGAEVNIGDFFEITGKNGTATFTQLNPGSHTFEVYKPGIEIVTDTFPLQECRSSPDEVFPPLNVTLDTNCATVNVNVLDNSEGSNPIPGATIEIAGKKTITDALGQASITQLTDNTEQTLFVNATGFIAPESKLIQLSCQTEANETVVMQPEILACAQLDVTIIDDSESALPISDALVTIASQRGITNSEGKATFLNLIAGPQTINVSANDFFPASPTDVALSCDTVTSEIITLKSKECATAEITVVDERENGIFNATVSIGSITLFTGDDGKATFTNLLEGTQTISVSADEFFPASPTDVALSCDVLTSEIITLKSKECATAEVRVVDDSGFGIFNAEVSIGSITASTDEGGRVTFTNLLEGTQTINVSADEFFPASPADVALSCDVLTSEIITLKSKECATAEIRVVDESGLGIFNAEVSIGSIIAAFTDEGGRVTFTNLLEGTQTINVSAVNFFPLDPPKEVVLSCANPASDIIILRSNVIQ